MSILVTGIAELVTNDPAAGNGSPLDIVRDAALAIDGGLVAWAGSPAADDTLRSLLAGRVAEARAQGTTTVEVKSGYGLTAEDEARALRRDDIGILSVGARADLAVLDAPSYVHLAYRSGGLLARAFPG